MFNFLFKKQPQHARVLELLIKNRKVTSLQLSQMHPVILNFHQQIHILRQKHNIETIEELVKGVKHTTYIYHGRLAVPCRWERKKKYKEEDVLNAFEA